MQCKNLTLNFKVKVNFVCTFYTDLHRSIGVKSWFLRLSYTYPVHIRDKSPILMKPMYNAVFSENSSQSCKLKTYFTEYFGNY